MDEKRREAIKHGLYAVGLFAPTGSHAAAFEQALRDAGFVVAPVEPTEAMMAAAVPEPTHLYLTGRGSEYAEQMKLAVQVDRLATADKYRRMIAAVE